MQLKYFLYGLIMLIPLSLGDKTCQSQRECNNGEDSIRCGICVDTNAPANKEVINVRKCIFPFYPVYESDNRCFKYTSCPYECGGHGKCELKGAIQKEIAPTCNCHEHYYGSLCQYQTPEDMSQILFRYIELPFESVKLPVVCYLRKASFLCGSEEKASKGYVEVISSDRGHYQRKPLSRKECVSSKQWLYYEYETRFRYLPLNDDKDNNVVTLEDDVLGYVTSYRITVVMKGITNYKRDFPVFVSYLKANLECAPVVKIPGWGSTKEEESTTTRKQAVKLDSQVHFIENGKYTSLSKPKPDCEAQAQYLWRVWKNKDADGDTTTYLQYRGKNLHFDSFSLEIAKYRILLEVTSVQDKPAVNYAYCYLNVKFEPLVAIIDGGSERTVQKHLGLSITTSRSKDPNMPLKNQGHVEASWSCLDITDNNKEICDPYKYLGVTNSYFIEPDKLNFGAVLKIRLKIWTHYYDNCETCGIVQPAFATVTIMVANETAVVVDYISIQCLLNCKEQVVNSEQLYLKVKKRNRTNFGKYVWTYREMAHSKEESTDNITLQGLPDFLFVAKQNAFSAGKNYTIVIRTEKHILLAKYSFETVVNRLEGNCSLDPMRGIRGLSTFNIDCQNFTTNHDSSLLYEFYDKNSEEAQEGLVFSGRMMGSSEDGKLRNFRITRGQVFVYIKDNSGLYTHKQFNVSLSDMVLTEEVLKDMFKHITDAKKQNDFTTVSNYISVIPDIVSNEMNKSKILEKLLHLVKDFPTNILPDVKMTSSTLINIIQKLNKPVYLKIDLRLMKNIVNVIQSQAELLSSAVEFETERASTSTDEIKHLATTLLTCIRAILLCKDPRTIGLNEFHVDFQTEDELAQISDSALESVYLIQNALTFLQRKGLPPIRIKSEDNAYDVLVVINDEDYDLTNYLDESQNVRVSVSKDFLKQFKMPTNEPEEDFVLRTAMFSDNIFWWRGSNVKSNLVHVSMVKKSQRKRLVRIKVVRKPLDVQLHLNRSLVNTTEISDITFQYQYNTKCSLDLDLAVKIHRLDPAPQSLITLKFLFPQTNGSLHVLIYKDRRPECDMMKKAVTISDKSPNYPPLLVLGDEPSFYYIGIIPGSDYINDSVRYTFQVNTTACQHWERGYWSAQGCKISDRKTKDLKVHCNCDRFSIFAAAFPVPPQEIDPFSDISLFLTVFDNPIVVIFVSVTLLIYLIACLWAFRKDRNDRMLRSVVILADNFPGDCYPYLLAVYTSSRFNAGTTAHVGIQVIGSLATSRTHILRSPERNTLRRNYDDWFLMYYSESLGELKNIHVWHDNAGSSPEWFCDKIVIYDLKDNLDAVFVVEQWLALRINCFPEAIVSAATIGEVKNLKRLFLDNCVLGLREGHLLLSIVFRHPRSAMSRLQKISVLMCCLMVAMLCSIMFYSPKVDKHGYNVGMRDFYISVQSLVVSFLITFLVLLAFKMSYKYTYQRLRSTTLYRTSNFEEYDALQNIRNRNTFYANYVRFVAKRFKGHPLVPVYMAESEHFVQKRTVCVWIAWLSCIAVIVACSFFVMLYGLKLGLVKSKMWLSAVFLSVGQELLIVGPLKILLLSILLALAFQKINETSTHRVFLEDALRIQSLTEMEPYETLSTKRSHPMYAPLRPYVVNKMLRKKELIAKWISLFDFVVSICFIIVLCIVMYELWTSHYDINRHVKDMVTQTHYHSRIRTVPFGNVRNITQVEKFLRFALVRSLYVTVWYNDKPISEVGVKNGFWMEDFTLKKIGLERLRQIRVTSVECTFKFINTTRRCIPRWDSYYEDTQDYSVGWGDAQWKDLQENNSLWKYTKSSLSTIYTMYRLYGESGTLYHDGGYLTHLGHNRLSTESTITDSISDHWQDQLTRAVFVEFTLFNVNQDLFSQVTLIVEYLISGNIKLSVEVLSVDSQIKISMWNAFPLLFVIYYVVCSGVQINRQGLMEFLKSSPNKVEMLVIALSVLCYVVATVDYFYSGAKYDDFIKSGQSSYFDFDSFVFYFVCLQMLLPLLFCVAILRSVLILRDGQTLDNYFYTLTLATPSVLCVTLLILLLQLLQLHLMFFLFIYSFCSIREIIINPKFFVPGEHIDIITRVFFLLKALFAGCLIKFYFLIFRHILMIAKTHKVTKSMKLDITACCRNSRKKT